MGTVNKQVTIEGPCDCCAECDCACSLCSDDDPCEYYEQYDVTIDNHDLREVSCAGTCDCEPFNGTFRLTRSESDPCCWYSVDDTYDTNFCDANSCNSGEPLWSLCGEVAGSPPTESWTLSPCNGYLGGSGSYGTGSSLCGGGTVSGGFGGTGACCGTGIFGQTLTITPVGSPVDCTAPMLMANGLEVAGPPRPKKLKVKIGRTEVVREWDGRTEVKVHIEPLCVGPGAQLKRMLKGVPGAKGCGCNTRAAEMDERGTQWCKDNVPTIVAWLEESWAKLAWYQKLMAAGKVLLAGYASTEALVLEAIKRAELSEKSQTP